MSEGALKELEVALTRKNKAKRLLRKEIDDRIEQLRLIEQDTEAILEKYLGSDRPTREDVEFDESGGQPLENIPTPEDVEFDENLSVQTSIPTPTDTANPLYLPIGTNVVDKNTYNYQITGYDTDNKPQFVFIGKDGKPNTAMKLKQSMLDEALKGYEAKSKELEQ